VQHHTVWRVCSEVSEKTVTDVDKGPQGPAFLAFGHEGFILSKEKEKRRKRDGKEESYGG
jgi:hypothetical protein